MNVYGKFTDILANIKNTTTALGRAKRQHHTLGKPFLLMAMMTLGSTGAWGQSDYSGTYYLAFPGKVSNPSSGYNSGNPETNYYLCPTEGYLYYQATNQCTTTDNGQPFLTTYTCKDGVYDADNAVWQLIKHTLNGQDYYYVKHVIDNKYLV